MQSLTRTFLAGLFGGMATNLAMILTFQLIGMGLDADGFLLNPEFQSEKVIAVWTQLDPLPMVATNPVPIAIGMILFCMGQAFIYRSVSPAWPPGLWARTFRMTGMVFFLSYAFWEFFTPFNQLGEPLPLIAAELIFWLFIAFAGSLFITKTMECNQLPI